MPNVRRVHFRPTTIQRRPSHPPHGGPDRLRRSARPAASAAPACGWRTGPCSTCPAKLVAGRVCPALPAADRRASARPAVRHCASAPRRPKSRASFHSGKTRAYHRLQRAPQGRLQPGVRTVNRLAGRPEMRQAKDAVRLSCDVHVFALVGSPSRLSLDLNRLRWLLLQKRCHNFWYRSRRSGLPGRPASAALAKAALSGGESSSDTTSSC